MSALLRNEVHYQNEIENSFRIISTAKEGPQVSHLDHDLTINDIALRYTYFLGARPSILLCKYARIYFASTSTKKYAKNIPKYPDQKYKDKGWKGWYDFLGNE